MSLADGGRVTAWLNIKRLHGDAPAPRYATDGAAGLDLSAALKEPITLPPGARAAVPTGFAIHIPAGAFGLMRPRSGRLMGEGLLVEGTIDSDYRGEVRIIAINVGDKAITIRPGDRIAQLVVVPCVVAHVVEVEELPETRRGVGGFGSTGR